MANDAGQKREQIRRERRILIANVAVQPGSVRELLRNVEIAAGIDDWIEPALVRLREGHSGDDEEKED